MADELKRCRICASPSHPCYGDYCEDCYATRLGKVYGNYKSRRIADQQVSEKSANKSISGHFETDE